MDPSTPCQANLGLLVGAIMFLTIAGLVSAVTIPLYCRPRNRVSPDGKYLEGEFETVELPPGEVQAEVKARASGSESGSEGEHSRDRSSSEESIED